MLMVLFDDDFDPDTDDDDQKGKYASYNEWCIPWGGLDHIVAWMVDIVKDGITTTCNEYTNKNTADDIQ